MARPLTDRLLAALDRLSGLSEGPAIKGRKHRAVPTTDLCAAPDPAAALVALQSPDGSFGGDAARSAAALASLALLGHTRQTGAHRERAIAAARWLEDQNDALGTLALDLLSAAESGAAKPEDLRYAALGARGAEGELFANLRSRQKGQ